MSSSMSQKSSWTVTVPSNMILSQKCCEVSGHRKHVSAHQLPVNGAPSPEVVCMRLTLGQSAKVLVVGIVAALTSPFSER